MDWLLRTRDAIANFDFSEWLFDTESELKGTMRMLLSVILSAGILFGVIMGCILLASAYPWVMLGIGVLVFVLLCIWAFRSDR